MSIVDSREELDEAKARLTQISEDDLANDIRFWSIATIDAADESRTLTERRGAALNRYEEAQSWVSLIAHEMRRRRDERLGDRPPVEP